MAIGSRLKLIRLGFPPEFFHCTQPYLSTLFGPVNVDFLAGFF
jgi:hypothetical protein